MRSYVRLLNPGFLLAGLAFYAVGLSVLDYLGLPADRGRALLGWLLVVSVQLTGQFTHVYFSTLRARPGDRRPTSPAPGGSSPPPAKLSLYAAIVAGGVTAILGTGMAAQSGASLAAWSLLGLGFAIALAYSVPPFRLETSGYGELAIAVGLAGFTPNFAFALQTGEIHRLVWLSTAPLAALTFAMLLARQLSSYAADLPRQHRNLLVRLGWETGMRMHDGAIAFAGLLLASAVAGGLPRAIGWGGLIVLPLAIAQTWQMRRIRSGQPPRWRNLTVSAVAMVGLMTYFTFLGFVAS